jgi:hypothetical protein
MNLTFLFPSPGLIQESQLHCKIHVSAIWTFYDRYLDTIGILILNLLFLPFFSISSFVIIPLYLKSLPVHSANCVKTWTVACRRVLSNAPLQIIGSRVIVTFENETYELNFTNYDYKYNYTMYIGLQILQFLLLSVFLLKDLYAMGYVVTLLKRTTISR